MADLGTKLVAIREQARSGRFEQAHAALVRLAQQHPDSIEVASTMARVLGALGRADQARHYALRTLALLTHEPRDADEASELAEIAAIGGEFDRAGRWLAAGAAMDPAHLGRHVLAARFCFNHGQFVECCRVCAAALPAFAHQPDLSMLFANSLRYLTRSREALAVLQHALAAQPDSLTLAINHASLLNYVPGVDPAEVLASHRRCASLIEKQAGPPLPAPGPRRPGPIRVGLVSGDLRGHSVASFVEPVLRGLDRARFHLTCYSVAPTEDAQSQRLRPLADVWTHVPKLSDADLAARIRNHDIDVLIDLSGLTAEQRLGAFALRPARRHITWLGYPNTTGLAAMGWRIVDSITDPPGAERWCTEQLVRLDPCFLCYQPPHDAPAVAPPPCERNGFITFGSFNSFLKMHEGLIATWADIVRAVPGSRLLLKRAGPLSEASRRAVLDRFHAGGVEPGRVEILDFAPTRREHLEAYAKVDIALDTFPYNGTTTTCEALYMGVPVVTLRGETHAGRVGASVLSGAGLSSLIAGSIEDYQSIARRLAGPGVHPLHLRQELRRRLAESALASGCAFAARLAIAIESRLQKAVNSQ